MKKENMKWLVLGTKGYELPAEEQRRDVRLDQYQLPQPFVYIYAIHHRLNGFVRLE